MTNEEMKLPKLAKLCGGKSFTKDDLVNEKLIRTAITFSMGMLMIYPTYDEVKSLTNDGENLYVLRYNPFMLLVAKAAVAANFGYVDGYDNNSRATVIFVDNRFMQFDDDSKKAIIAHEIGHTMSNHQATNNRRTLTKENQADSYGAKILGVDNMVAALSKISGGDFISRIELKLRIHMLKKQTKK